MPGNYGIVPAYNWHSNVEDVCSFGVNTINIFSGCNKKGSILNLNIFITRDENIYGIYKKKKQKKTKKKNFLYILLFSCFNVSDFITDVAKQNRNIMTLAFSLRLPQRGRKTNMSANQNNFDAGMLLSFRHIYLLNVVDRTIFSSILQI